MQLNSQIRLSKVGSKGWINHSVSVDTNIWFEFFSLKKCISINPSVNVFSFQFATHFSSYSLQNRGINQRKCHQLTRASWIFLAVCMYIWFVCVLQCTVFAIDVMFNLHIYKTGSTGIGCLFPCLSCCSLGWVQVFERNSMVAPRKENGQQGPAPGPHGGPGREGKMLQSAVP